jgi:hypothetical protein
MSEEINTEVQETVSNETQEEMDTVSQTEEVSTEVVESDILEGIDWKNPDNVNMDELSEDQLFEMMKRQEEWDGIEEEEDTNKEDEEPKEEVKKFKVKVNGEELEVEQEELVKNYQLAKASQAKFEEATSIMKNVQSALQTAKEKPLEFLERLGHNPKDFILEQAQKILDEEEGVGKTPEQIELEKQRKEIEQQKKEWEEKRKQEEQQKQYQEINRKLDNEIDEAFNMLGVERSPEIIKELAQKMLNSYDKEGNRPSAYEILKGTLEQKNQYVNKYLTSKKVDELVNDLPKEFVDSLRQYFVSKVKKDSKDTLKAPKQNNVSKNQEGQRKSVEEELFEALKDIKL